MNSQFVYISKYVQFYINKFGNVLTLITSLNSIQRRNHKIRLLDTGYNIIITFLCQLQPEPIKEKGKISSSSSHIWLYELGLLNVKIVKSI